MALLKKTLWQQFKDYFMITLGILVYVLGWTIFLVPNNLIAGGMSGVASIIQYATGIKMGFTYGFVNIFLMIAALIVLGRNFGIKTFYAIILASVGLNCFQGLLPVDFCNALSVENGKLVSTIFGGVLEGVGIGMTMSVGGSTGGTDIIALIVNKYRNISPGKMLLMMDAIIIASSLLVPSYMPDGSLMPLSEKFTTVIYAVILVMVSSTVVDAYLAGSRQSVQLFIFSKKYAEIADAINHDLGRGVTVLEGQGWYTKNESKVLLVLTRKTDLNLLLKYIKTIDPRAFLSVSIVRGVYGEGFDSIKK